MQRQVCFGREFQGKTKPPIYNYLVKVVPICTVRSRSSAEYDQKRALRRKQAASVCAGVRSQSPAALVDSSGACF